MRNSDKALVEQRLENMMASVKAAGIKLTPQRLEIFRVLASSEDHPSAETLLRGVQERLPTVSLDTVYRTLWMLHDLGVVRTLGPGSSGVRFDPNATQHHHFVCERCGLVRDFRSEALDALEIPAAARRFGSVTEAHVEVRGICGPCRRKDRNPAG